MVVQREPRAGCPLVWYGDLPGDLSGERSPAVEGSALGTDVESP